MVHDDYLLFVYKTSNHDFPSKICVDCFVLYKNHIRSIIKKEISTFFLQDPKTENCYFPYKEQEFSILFKAAIIWELREGWLG